MSKNDPDLLTEAIKDLKNFLKELPEYRIGFNFDEFWGYVIVAVVCFGVPIKMLYEVGLNAPLEYFVMAGVMMAIGAILGASLGAYKPSEDKKPDNREGRV